MTRAVERLLRRASPGPLTPAEHAELARALAAGPWSWPREGTPDWRTALAFHGGPPRLEPGAVPVLACTPSEGSIWAFSPEGWPSAGEQGSLDESARRAWRSASRALPRAVPLLVESPAAVALADEPLRLIGRTPVGAVAHEAEARIGGDSPGLAFVLALASLHFRLAIPDDVVPLAAVSPLGETSPVGGLDVKLRAVRDWWPRARRLLVDREQREEDVERARGLGLEVIAVRTAADAVEEVFGARLRERFAALGGTPAARATIATLFETALLDRTAVPDWRPVQAAAEIALGWPGLDPDARSRLQLVLGIAARHEGRPVASDAWTDVLDRLDPERGYRLAAHLVQQAADWTSPDDGEIEALFARVAPSRLDDATDAALMLHGAYARFRAQSGEHRDALERQHAIARVFLSRSHAPDATRQAAECFRLARVIGDAHELERAEDLRRSLAAATSYAGCPGRVYVEHARACARVALGVAGLDEIATLRTLTGEATDHLRTAACRWLVRALRQSGHGPEAEAELAALRRAAEVEAEAARDTFARRNLLFIELDDALRHGRGGAVLHVDALERLEPPRIRRLRAVAARLGCDPVEYVARAYPY